MPSDKFEKSQLLHTLLPFQNGRVIPVEETWQEEGYICKIDLKNTYFSFPLNLKIPKVCKFQIEGSMISVPLILLRFGTSAKDIHKVDQNCHFSVEKTICTTDYFSG